MTQSHLPRTGRGVTEAEYKMLPCCNIVASLPFQKKMQAFCCRGSNKRNNMREKPMDTESPERNQLRSKAVTMHDKLIN